MVKKVLHVVGTLDVGGIEKWVCNMINHEKENENETDFYIFSADPKKIKILKDINIDNSKVYLSNGYSVIARIISFIRALVEVKPDAIHFHPGYSSGVYLIFASFFSISIKITHSHSDRRNTDRNVSIAKKLYIKLMKIIINKMSDFKVAVSKNAGLSLFDTDFITHYCGVPLPTINNEKIQEIAIDNESFNLFHIGRCSDAKNYPFILALAERLMSDYRYKIYCLGDGLKDYETEAKERKIENIFFPGFVQDPPSVISTQANLFIMPSLWEGLPLSVVEAQKCHIPCIVSLNITEECNIGLARFLPLDIDLWVKEIECEIEKKGVNVKSISLVDKFTLEANMIFFKELYRGNHVY